jgi:hypothetical protein
MIEIRISKYNDVNIITSAIDQLAKTQYEAHYSDRKPPGEKRGRGNVGDLEY